MFTLDGDHCCIIFFGCRSAFVDLENLATSFITTSHQFWFTPVKTFFNMYATTTR